MKIINLNEERDGGVVDKELKVVCYRKAMLVSFGRTVFVEIWADGRMVDQRRLWGVWALPFFERRLLRKIRIAKKMAAMLLKHSS